MCDPRYLDASHIVIDAAEDAIVAAPERPDAGEFANERLPRAWLAAISQDAGSRRPAPRPVSRMLVNSGKNTRDRLSSGVAPVADPAGAAAFAIQYRKSAII